MDNWWHNTVTDECVPFTKEMFEKAIAIAKEEARHPQPYYEIVSQTEYERRLELWRTKNA